MKAKQSISYLLAAVLIVLASVLGYLFGVYSSSTPNTVTTTETSYSTISSTTTVSAIVTSTASSSLSTNTAQFSLVIPWNTSRLRGANYLAIPNHCSGPAVGTGCLSSNFSEAYIFTCLKEAATPQGCTVQINATNSRMYYTVTVWYPYHNQTAGGPSWSNCSLDVPGGNPNRLLKDMPSYCVPVGANGFVLTQPMGIPN